MTDRLNEDAEHQAAHSRMQAMQKKNPHAKYSVIKGAKSGKWHVVHHTSGGMRMVESFEDFLDRDKDA